jgi:biopolymer transport protein ExbD/biopolymer transport protein TolR
MLADKTDKTIFVRADARAQFKSVEDAIDDVRTAGVETVNLLTDKREGNQVGGE